MQNNHDIITTKRSAYMSLNLPIKKILIITGVAALAVAGSIPFFKTGTSSNKTVLVVDFHGYMPSSSRTPTADEPDVFNSTYYIAQQFMEENPDIEIQWAKTKPVGGMDSEVAQWFTTQIAGGTVPAIAFSWGTQYQDRNWYLPLDEYLDAENSWPYGGGYSTWREVFRDYLWDNRSIKDVRGDTVAIPLTVYPGASTGYFYNKSAFAKAGIEKTPTTWGEFLNDSSLLVDNGYIGVEPWSYFDTTTTFDGWVFQFIFGPSYAGGLMDQTDYDHDGHVSWLELCKGTVEGLYSPSGVNGAAAQEMFTSLKHYYQKVLEPGWSSIDYYSLWNSGDVGIREEGLWALPSENANVMRDFDYGVFVAPPVSKDTSSYVKEVTYEKGPYHPDPDLAVNIMKAAVEGKPKMLDAALRFLKFVSKPSNISLITMENGGVLGGVKGTLHSNLIDEFIKGDFPRMPDAAWPTGFTSEYGDQLNRKFEEWVNGTINDAAFFSASDEIQSKGVHAFIKKTGIDTTGWKVVL